MKKIRINELARELEVKAHEILDRLPELGVTEKKTHSSSIDEDVAIKLRRLYGFDVPDLPASEMVEQIQESVNTYYSQFEDASGGETAAVAEPATAEEPAETAPAEVQTEEEQSGTIESAGFPTHNSDEGAGPEVTGPVPGTAEERDA